MLLYSTRRKQFMGLIPNEQNRFIQGIRTLINKHKVMQQKVGEILVWRDYLKQEFLKLGLGGPYLRPYI